MSANARVPCDLGSGLTSYRGRGGERDNNKLKEKYLIGKRNNKSK